MASPTYMAVASSIEVAQREGYRYGLRDAAQIVRAAFRCDQGDLAGVFNGKVDLARWGRELSDEILSMDTAARAYALADAMLSERTK